MGGFSVGGLITGLDTNNIISQLISIERFPIIRIENRIEKLEAQRDAIKDLRTTLLTLRNRAQDFRLKTIFSKFSTISSEDSVLTATARGSTPAQGSFVVDVLQLASSTVATSSDVLGAAINPAIALPSSGLATTVTSGNFSINGVAINVNAGSQTLNDVLNSINISGAGVTATFDPVTDRVTIANTAPGNTDLINLGASGDTSNFLTAINVVGATQTDDVNGSTSLSSTLNLGAVDPGAVINTLSFRNGIVGSGNFFVNGAAITVNVAVDTIADVVARINSSDAQVTASFDTTNDTIRIVSDLLGSRSISFASGTSNFLEVTNLAGANPATQAVGSDAQFTLDGGPVQIRNTNEVTDAIGGVVLELLSVGTSQVTVSADTDAVVESVQEFITAFNEATKELDELLARDAALHGDSTIRTIDTILRANIFGTVGGLTGPFNNLIVIGISSGNAFASADVFKIELDEETFLEAFSDDPTNVIELFSNSGGTGIADVMFDFLDQVTRSTGSLNARAKANGTIDRQIQSANDRIERLEDRLVVRERRLRAQFSRLEQLSAGFLQQSAALSGLQGGLFRFI